VCKELLSAPLDYLALRDVCAGDGFVHVTVLFADADRPEFAFLLHQNPAHDVLAVDTGEPSIAAVLYFLASFSKPDPRVCLPFVQVAPSHSMATF
jgi:hypothetical protein